MAHKRIEGPYEVQPPSDDQPEWEIVEMVDGKPERLRPRIKYPKDKRSSAYRRLALMNRKWQRENKEEEVDR